MANPVTLETLITTCRERAGMENSTFITGTELIRLINSSARRLYTQLIEARGQAYYETSYIFNTVSGTAAYQIPADFFQLIGVDVNINGYVHTMHAYMNEERNMFQRSYAWGSGMPMYYRIIGAAAGATEGTIKFVPVPSGVYAVTLSYVPAPVTLVAEDDKVNGVAGWEDFIVWDVVAAMLAKEESDTAFAISQREMVRAEIKGLAANRDAGQPERVQDVLINEVGPFWAL